MKFNAELITCIRQTIKADEYYPYTAHVGISESAISAIKQHVHSEMQDNYGVSIMPTDEQITHQFLWAAPNA